MEQADRILIQRLACSRNADAFAEIMRQYTPLVYSAGWRLLRNDAQAADVVQETFFHLLKNARTIQGSLATWLHRVATRRAIDLIRQNTARRRREESYAAVSQLGESEWNEIEPLVDQVLDQLPDELRDILIRHFLEGQTMDEIAVAYGVSQPTISRRVTLGLEKLRTGLRARGVMAGILAVASALSNTSHAIPAPLLVSLGKLALASAAWSDPPASTAAGTLVCGLGLKSAAGLAIGILGPALVWWTIHQDGARTKLPGAPNPTERTSAFSETVGQPGRVGALRVEPGHPTMDPVADFTWTPSVPNLGGPSRAVRTFPPGHFQTPAAVPTGDGSSGVSFQTASGFLAGGGIFVNGGSASGSIQFGGAGVTGTNTASGGFVIVTNYWSDWPDPLRRPHQ